MLARLASSCGDLDAAELAAPADLHLRLDRARVADLVGRRDGLIDRRARACPRARGCRGGRTAACPDTRADPSAGADSSTTFIIAVALRAIRQRGASPATCHCQQDHVRHLRRLRHPDRLGDRDLGRLRRGGRTRRLHDRARRGDPAVPRDRSARSRAAPTSSTPRCCAARRSRSPSASAGRSSRRAPASCPTRSSAGCRSRRPARAREARQEVQARPDLEHRRQAARPDAPPHPDRLRPRRHRAAGPLLQARPRPLQRVRAADRRQEGLGARRRRATTTTSSRA